MNEKLTVFFYLLLRDELPAGKIIHLIQEVEKLDNDIPLFTNNYLENCARSFVERLK